MQINPNEIIEKKILIPTDDTKVQQVGIDCTLAAALVLEPRSYANIAIAEKIALPDDVYMELKLRSSLARRGILMGCGLYDPGFHGDSGCILHNLSDNKIVLAKGTRICQAVFYEANAASSYQGKYNDGGVEPYAAKEINNGN